MYDYEGAEAEDLPVVEGEELTVVERGKSSQNFGRQRYPEHSRSDDLV